MSEKKEALNVEEQTAVIKYVYDSIREYESINDLNVFFEDLNTDGTPCIGLFTMPGAIYTKKFITGSFEALLPFSVVYRTNLNVDSQKFKQIERLNSFAEWMTNIDNLPILSGGRAAEKIEQTSVPYRNIFDAGCENDYIVTFQMTYRKDE